MAEKKSTVKTWNSAVASSIRQALAPKGFSEISQGPFKRRVKSNIDFLSKNTVIQVEQIAMGALTHYRNGIKEIFRDRIADCEKTLLTIRQSKTYFWQFTKKKFKREQLIITRTERETIQTVLEELDSIELKNPVK